MNIRRCGALLAAGCMLAPVSALAQALTAPRLEIDFAGGSIPLSPALSVAIGLAVAAIGAYALRRAGRGRGVPVVALAIGAGALALAAGGVHVIARADATLPTTQLTVSASPTVVDTTFIGDMTVINGLSTPITITAVIYDTGSYDYYVDATGTTCVGGTTLLPGATCNIRILSLG